MLISACAFFCANAGHFTKKWGRAHRPLFPACSGGNSVGLRRHLGANPTHRKVRDELGTRDLGSYTQNGSSSR